MNHKQYYRKLLFERIKAQFMATTFLAIVVISPIWLIYIVVSSEGDVDKLNECYKTYSVEYCQNNVK